MSRRVGMVLWVMPALVVGCAAAGGDDGETSSSSSDGGSSMITSTGTSTGGMGTGGNGGNGGMATGNGGTGGMATGGNGGNGGTGGMATGGNGGMATGGNGGNGGMGTGGMGTGGMGTGGMGTGGMGDVTPPTVMSISPADGTMALPPSPTLSVTFSEPMLAASITTNNTTACSGSLQLSSDNFTTCVPLTTPTTSDDTTFDAQPMMPLDSAINYALRVTTTVQDQALNNLANTFDTAQGLTIRYAHTIVIDGTNDFDAQKEAITPTTAGGTVYISYDDTHLYLGLAHPDVQVAGNGNKFVYFILSADPALATGNGTSSDNKAQFANNAKLSYHYKEQIDGPSYSEFRVGNGADWTTDWTANGKASARAAGFLEASIALSELGNPASVAVTTFTIDYFGDNGNGWLYNMIQGSTDGSGATPRTLASYLSYGVPTSLWPNAMINQQAF